MTEQHPDPETDQASHDVAGARANASAERIFAATGLDQELDDLRIQRSFDSVRDWFARYDDELGE